MNPITSFFCKVLVYIDNKKAAYIFERSKRYITSWGEGTYGYPNVICYDTVSKLSVGKYTSIASNVSILLGSNHKKGLITTYPRSLLNKKFPQKDTNEQGDVSIGNDVLIGYGVTIIGPATIGDGAIIGASALVIGDVPPYTVVGGVPAKPLKKRFQENEIKALLAISWWDKTKEEVGEMEGDLYSQDVSSFISRFGK